MKITDVKQPFDFAQGSRKVKITDIRLQVKRQDRFSVFVDGKYMFSFSQDEILHLGLKINQEFTPGELEQLKKSAVEDKAYDRALNLIARRPRSRWELEDYLKRKDYDKEIVEKTLNKLSERGYVNDVKFAEAWVRSRRLLKPTSKRRLILELRQKRVDSEAIEKVLEEDETDEREVLRDLVARKRKRYPDKLKFMQYLARQGYNYDDIKSVLEDSN